MRLAILYIKVIIRSIGYNLPLNLGPVRYVKISLYRESSRRKKRLPIKRYFNVPYGA